MSTVIFAVNIGRRRSRLECVVQLVLYRNRLFFNCCFLDTDISQGSVATRLRCVGIFSYSYLKLFPDSGSEISLKIGQYLMKLTRTKMVQFWATLYITIRKRNSFIRLYSSFKQLTYAAE